jgi:hypothetical protein
MSEGDMGRSSAFATAAGSKPGSPSPLDSLLSPKSPTFNELSQRESIADTDYVILDDDPRFSTVSLSGIASAVPEADTDDTLSKLNRRTTISSASSKAFSTLRHFSHRKSASTITISSIPGSNILARLGSGTRDESAIEALGNVGEGQQKLHEEFLRLHNERRAEATESEQGGIDWGKNNGYASIYRPNTGIRFLGSRHLR